MRCWDCQAIEVNLQTQNDENTFLIQNFPFIIKIVYYCQAPALTWLS